MINIENDLIDRKLHKSIPHLFAQFNVNLLLDFFKKKDKIGKYRNAINNRISEVC